MEISDMMIENIKRNFGYNEQEIQIWLENPRNKDVLSKSMGLLSKTIVIEVVKSHGCNSQHKEGDKFYFDGAGNLLTKISPKKICIHALSAVEPLIFAANELYYAGADPNEMRFNRVDCMADVGLNCGGWGKVVMEIKVVDRKKIKLENK
ncbi:MAG: TIGR04076 family protein [Promethearchaeota archaeon]